MTEDVVDAEVVQDAPTQPDHPQDLSDERYHEGAALVPQAREQSVLRPLPAAELVSSFQEYQTLRGQLLVADDYQDAGRGRKFVKKSGWRKIATAFGLDLEIVSMDVDRDAEGVVLRASCIARASAASGRHADGDGYCDVAEDRFSGNRGNKTKLENDLRTTATTRATNRAISNLVGMGEVSADEVDGGSAQAPPYGPEASEEMQDRLLRALVWLSGGDQAAGTGLYNATGQTYQYIPQAVAASIVRVAATLRNSGAEVIPPPESTTDQEEVPDGNPDEGARSEQPGPDDGPAEGPDAAGE